MSSALKHFLEHTAAEDLPRFQDWFPPCFDWRRLCRDVPVMAERAGLQIPTEVGDEHEIEQMAQAVFSAAHLFTLAVLAAGSGDDDPRALLDHLTRPPSEEEEEMFEALVAENLQAVDMTLGGEEAEGGDPEVVPRALGLVEVSWPAVEHLLMSDEAKIFERAGPIAAVLGALCRVAAALAAFRWLAAEAHEPEWPRPTLQD